MLAVGTGEAAVLERYFNEPVADPPIRVIDLAMMGWTLAGGEWRRGSEPPRALYVYRSPAGAELVCQMYAGQLDDLPVADAIHRENGFEFRAYRRDTTTLVFWQEGALVCVLAADLPTTDVLGLAVAKAMAPA
jgi:hypothetical protein